MNLRGAQELSPSLATTTIIYPNHIFNFRIMRVSALSPLYVLRSLSLSLHHHRSFTFRHRILSYFSTYPVSSAVRIFAPPHFSTSLSATQSSSTFDKHLVGKENLEEEEEEELWDLSKNDSEIELHSFGEVDFARKDTRHLTPTAESVEVKELEELPEQWRRSKLAWLCKELPAHKSGTFVRILNAQRKWMRQEDATYVAVHCTRIRENEAGFKVYRWMTQQHWYRFDFALATKLADYMGKERKFTKCRELFDDIINQGRVPSESTFHILVVAYLSAPIRGCLEEACGIYNRMIQLGGYQPRLSLHNSLFRALISKPGDSSKHNLKQAEFIFHNIVTSGLEIQEDIFIGLIWLHSYQDTIDKERIMSLRDEMRQAGFQEGREVYVAVLRACSKEGDVDGAETSWLELLRFDGKIPSQAFVYKMEVYSKSGNFMKSFNIFREMEEFLGSASVAGYHKIIEIMCKAQQVEIAESLMKEFVNSGKKPLMPSYIDLTGMYLALGLHDKLELAFTECMEKCRPNQTLYNIYLDCLVKVGNINKAREVFNVMQSDTTIGVNTRTCNTILKGYLTSGEYIKAEKIYDIMCQKKYDIDPPLMEKLDYVLSLVRKEVKKPVSYKLSKEQREILVGLLLGGLQIVSDEKRKNHMIKFEFRENSSTHSILRRHIHNQYHEWLHPSSKASDVCEDIPYKFSTYSNSYFGFYAEQFWPKGSPEIPKLIHRWLSPRTLAYWYMYGGHKLSSGDILLKLRGNLEGVEKVVKALKGKSLDCRVKKKGRVYWIGLLGSNSTWFWKLIEPYMLDDLRDLETCSEEPGSIKFDGVSDCDDAADSSGD